MRRVDNNGFYAQIGRDGYADNALAQADHIGDNAAGAPLDFFHAFTYRVRLVGEIRVLRVITAGQSRRSFYSFGAGLKIFMQ
ncbi:MAG: hypothetical protein LBK43_10215 [Treponema sp.]|jgi:hypothetical protein|nr:hypothetical protein [Treponema sp.]